MEYSMRSNVKTSRFSDSVEGSSRVWLEEEPELQLLLRSNQIHEP